MRQSNHIKIERLWDLLITNLLRVWKCLWRFVKVCNVSNAYTPLERWRPEKDCKNDYKMTLQIRFCNYQKYALVLEKKTKSQTSGKIQISKSKCEERKCLILSQSSWQRITCILRFTKVVSNLNWCETLIQKLVLRQNQSELSSTNNCYGISRESKRNEQNKIWNQDSMIKSNRAQENEMKLKKQ